jgi:hypothetical protein
LRVGYDEKLDFGNIALFCPDGVGDLSVAACGRPRQAIGDSLWPVWLPHSTFEKASSFRPVEAMVLCEHVFYIILAALQR